MLELPLDVGEQGARPEAEQVGPEPTVTQLVLYEIHVLERILRRPNAPGWFEAHRVAGLLVVVANHARHDEREWERRIDALLPRRRLDEVGAGLHRDHTRAGDVAEGRQLAGGEDRLHVRVAARRAKCAH